MTTEISVMYGSEKVYENNPNKNGNTCSWDCLPNGYVGIQIRHGVGLCLEINQTSVVLCQAVTI